MTTDPTTKMMQELALRKALNNNATLLDRAKSINFSGVKPAVKRFAGNFGSYLPRSLPSWGKNIPAVGKNIPYLNAALGTGMGIYNLSEGQNPIDAFGRPLFQVGGGILGAGTGFLADSPFSPAADIALGYAGWEAGGRTYDALFDRDKDIEIGTKELTMVDGTKVTVPIELVNGQEVGVEVDEFPNDFRKPPSHLAENRGPKHLVTGEGPKHLETGEGPKHLSDSVDQFLTDREEWEQRTQNSPARRSGAFTDDELWALQQKHRDWKAARGR